MIDRLLCRAISALVRQWGRLTQKRMDSPTRYSVLPVPYMRFSKVTVVRNRGFPNECREKSVILSWAGIRSGFGRFSR